MSSKPIIVLYHHPCSDGMAAALAAYLKLGDTATYIGCTSEARPDIPDGALVYFVDYSWKAADLEALAARCYVIIIDHHKTAQVELEAVPNAHWAKNGMDFPARPEGWTGLEVYFDNNRSGAVLAWEYFHPGKELPMMFVLVQDRDLWRWVHGDVTKAFSSFLRNVPLTLESYARILKDSREEVLFKAMIAQGCAINDYEANLTDVLMHNAREFSVGGHPCMAINSPWLQSELGAALLVKYPQYKFSCVYYRTGGGDIKYSLRANGEFDVSELASLFNGGGHANAAGFTLGGVNILDDAELA